MIEVWLTGNCEEIKIVCYVPRESPRKAFVDIKTLLRLMMMRTYFPQTKSTSHQPFICLVKCVNLCSQMIIIPILLWKGPWNQQILHPLKYGRRWNSGTKSLIYYCPESVVPTGSCFPIFFMCSKAIDFSSFVHSHLLQRKLTWSL